MEYKQRKKLLENKYKIQIFIKNHIHILALFYFSFKFVFLILCLQMLVYEYMPNGALRNHLSGIFYALIF